MDPRTRQRLLDADDPVAHEFPEGFDWTAAMARVGALVPALEAVVGRPLTIDNHVQDASFFTDVACHREVSHPGMGRVVEWVFAVRFSCFGDLFTVISAADVAPSMVEQVIAVVSGAGFVHVPAAELSEPYTGSHPSFLETTWWIRFFDYL
jgi:hypothetical protein